MKSLAIAVLLRARFTEIKWTGIPSKLDNDRKMFIKALSQIYSTDGSLSFVETLKFSSFKSGK